MRRLGKQMGGPRRAGATGDAASEVERVPVAGLPPPLSRRQQRATARKLARQSRIEERDLVLELPLQVDDEGWPAPLHARSDALPTAAHPFVCAPWTNDAESASARIKREVRRGHVRLLALLHLSAARVVDAQHVAHLCAASITSDDATAHALLEQLGAAGVDAVYLPGAVVVFTGSVEKTLEVRSMQPVEGRRGRAGRRLLQHGLLALASAAIVGVALAAFGIDAAFAELGAKVDVRRVADADLHVPVWTLVAGLLITTGIVTALRRRPRVRVVLPSRVSTRRARPVDEHDREPLLPA